MRPVHFSVLAVALVLAALVAGAAGGYFFAKNGQPASLPAVQIPHANQPQTKNLPASFASQANFNGMIIDLNGKTVTVKASDNQTKEFTLSPNVIIVDPSVKQPQNVSSAKNPPALPLNKPLLITLTFVSSDYQITSVVLPPPVK